MQKNVSRTVLISLAVVVIGGIAVMGYVFRGAENSVAKQKAVYSLTADELFTFFEEDEASANEKFLGKVIEVSGEVAEIEKTETGQLVVLLSCNSPMGGVRCTFEVKQDNVSKQVSQGALCTIKGKCSGMLMDVVLDNCSLND
jgi:hypothetical protein